MLARRMRTRRLTVLVAAAAVFLTACGSTGAGVTAGRSRGVATQDTTVDTGSDTTDQTETTDQTGTTDQTQTTDQTGTTDQAGTGQGATIDFGPDKTPQPYDGFLKKAIADIQAFWRKNFPLAFGKPYPELKNGVWAVYPGRTDVPGCGQANTLFKDVEGNAFYCFLGDFVAYDDHTLLPELHSQLGDSVIGIVFAHEWGHAIQQRAGVDTQNVPTITSEQQADCFAGAWAAHLARGENPKLKFTDDDVRKALLGMTFIRDAPGAVSTDPSAHGSAFDRVGAFQDGFTNGVKQCATYIDNPPPTIQFPFTQDELNQRGSRAGDAPFDDQPSGSTDQGIFQIVDQSLREFWPKQLEGSKNTFTPPPRAVPVTKDKPADCPTIPKTASKLGSFYCKDNNTVFFDEDLAKQLYDKIGDFGPALLVSIGWSYAAQNALGSTLEGKDRSLANDCLTGAWTQFLVPDANGNVAGTTRLSPGDLDEAVQTMIAMSDKSSTDNVVGTAFERISSFRAGVLGGLDACKSRLQG